MTQVERVTTNTEPDPLPEDPSLLNGASLDLTKLIEGIRIRTGEDLAQEDPNLLRSAAVDISILLEGDKRVIAKTAEQLCARPEDSLYATFPGFAPVLGHISVIQAGTVESRVGSDSPSPIVFESNHTELASLMVLPEIRGIGIGPVLLNAALNKVVTRELSDIGSDRMRLPVVSAVVTSEASKRTFAKLGIVPEGESTDRFTRCLVHDLRGGHYKDRLDEHGKLEIGKELVSRALLLLNPAHSLLD